MKAKQDNDIIEPQQTIDIDTIINNLLDIEGCFFCILINLEDNG